MYIDRWKKISRYRKVEIDIVERKFITRTQIWPKTRTRSGEKKWEKDKKKTREKMDEEDSRLFDHD